METNKNFINKINQTFEGIRPLSQTGDSAFQMTLKRKALLMGIALIVVCGLLIKFLPATNTSVLIVSGVFYIGIMFVVYLFCCHGCLPDFIINMKVSHFIGLMALFFNAPPFIARDLSKNLAISLGITVGSFILVYLISYLVLRAGYRRYQASQNR